MRERRFRTPFAMGSLALKSHVGFALVDGEPVFLDLLRDRYFGLDAEAQAAFLALVAGTPPLTAKQIGSLEATGLFAKSREPGLTLPAAAPQASRTLDVRLNRPGLRDVVEAWQRIRRARRALARSPLHRIVENRRALIQAASAPDTSAVAHAASLYCGARAWLTRRPTCLIDSLALLDWLLARGLPANLVFGVKLEPFAAHCWIQHGDVILNDAPDRVTAFTPILSLQ